MTLDAMSELNRLEQTLDFHLQRHSVLSSNLANADTPGYAPQDLVLQDAFDDTLSQLHTTNERHMGGSQNATPMMRQTVEMQPSGGIDRNGVQVEHSLAQVTANRLRYETGIELTRRRFALLRYAVTDGSGG